MPGAGDHFLTAFDKLVVRILTFNLNPAGGKPEAKDMSAYVFDKPGEHLAFKIATEHRFNQPRISLTFRDNCLRLNGFWI